MSSVGSLLCLSLRHISLATKGGIMVVVLVVGGIVHDDDTFLLGALQLRELVARSRNESTQRIDEMRVGHFYAVVPVSSGVVGIDLHQLLTYGLGIK